MASVNTVTNLESKNKVTSHFNLSDIVFICCFVGLAYIFKNYVNTLVQAVYIIFNFLCAIYLTLPSKCNNGRNNMQSIAVLIRKDMYTYRPYTGETEREHATD